MHTFDAAIFNFDLLKTRYQEKMALNVITLFLKDLPEALEKIEEAYEAKDWSALEQLIHKFRGGVSYCCAEQLTDACASLQSCLRDKQTKQIENAYTHFMAQVLLLEEEMNSLMEVL